MTNTEIADEYGKEQDLEICIFQSPSFEGALLGFTDDGRAVYDYDLMIQSLMIESNCDEDEARDRVSNDTCQSCRNPNSPIVIFQPSMLEEHNCEMSKIFNKL